MTRDEILDAARECISEDRNRTYGDAATNFGNIAALWSVYLGVNIELTDVGPMLALFKIARFKANPSHADSAIDCAGYIALAGELSTSVDKV